MACRISAAGEFAQFGSYLHTMLWWLIQLGVGVDVKTTPWQWRCGAACTVVAVSSCSLLNSNIYGIQTLCLSIIEAHDEYQWW